MLRIKGLRWEFGTVLPDEIKYNLCEQEVGKFIKKKIYFTDSMCKLGEVCIIQIACTNDIHSHVSNSTLSINVYL